MTKTLYLFITLFIIQQIALAGVSPSINKSNSYEILASEDLGSEIKEKNFHQIINNVYALYAATGAKLRRPFVISTADWQKPYFSAWAAYNESQNLYSINFWGGFARIPSMTESAFALTVCHEIGHIIGGAPYHKSQHNNHMSAEGQSDFFASALCFKKYALNYDLPVPTEQNPYGTALCYDKFKNENAQFELCLQTLKAGNDLAKVLVFTSFRDIEVAYDTPSNEVVDQTNTDGYPSIQCRLDTFMRGSLAKYNAKHINLSDEAELRPECWFKNEP